MKSQLELKDDFLLVALEHVTFEGWTEATLKETATELDWEKAQVSILFPQGVASLMAHFADYTDRAMVSRYNEQSALAKGIGQKVTLAVKLRLQILAPYKEAVRRSVAYYGAPQRAPLGAIHVYNAADKIWSLVGVRSTDFSYYTRRISLAGVLSATTLFWLADETEGHQATWTFLNHRIADIGKFAQFRQKLMSGLKPKIG